MFILFCAHWIFCTSKEEIPCMFWFIVLSYILSRLHIFVCQSNRPLSCCTWKYGLFFHSIVCLDIQFHNSAKGFKVMISIKCEWHIFMAIVLLWSKLLYIVPMFQATFTKYSVSMMCVCSSFLAEKWEEKLWLCSHAKLHKHSCSSELRGSLWLHPGESEDKSLSHTHCSQFWFSSSWQSEASYSGKAQEGN